MSILKRFTDIMSCNINALLDKAEDPAKMVDQLIRNLNEDLNKVKAETASVMAEEVRAKREVDSCKADISKMLEYAKRAVDAGNDDDARQFLSKKARLSENLVNLEQRYGIAKANSDKMKEMHKRLTDEINELNDKRNTIKAKIATAKAQEKINKIGSSLKSSKSSLDAFSRMEEKANRMLNEANAMAELNEEKRDEIDDLMSKYSSSNSSVEDELESLKNSKDSSIEDELYNLKKTKEE